MSSSHPNKIQHRYIYAAHSPTENKSLACLVPVNRRRAPNHADALAAPNAVFGKERCTAMANKAKKAEGYYALVG